MEEGITPWLLKILQIKQTVFISLVFSLWSRLCKRNWDESTKSRCKKALIVTDEGLFKFGVADTISGYLKDAGVDSHIFPGAEPNPTDINVHNGVKPITTMVVILLFP
jgi:alcohol dehydrogenase class IV